MVSGTMHDEKLAQRAEVNADSGLKFLRDRADRARNLYATASERYQRQGSDVFMNAWFKRSHLDPAWKDLEKVQAEAVQRETALLQSTSRVELALLKVLYRLGIVLLSMVLVHWLCRSVSRYGQCGG